MRILVDENVPYGREAFGTLGEVRTAHGRKIERAMLMDVDALIIRSITKVDRALIEGTPVRFVGTCTIGEDHVDKAYLAEAGIAFSSAPGCNAGSVSQYIASALVTLSKKHGLDMGRMKLGILGVGNVGSKVARVGAALGFECVLNDPPLFEKTRDSKYRPIEEILDCDIITLHVPLHKTGPWPTWHLADEAFLAKMKPGALPINSSRGAVCCNQALKAALRSGHLRGAALDVWEGEPRVDIELLACVDIATPHIAGYSFDGKVNGTRQILEALCASLGMRTEWDPAPLLPVPEVPEISVDSTADDALPDAVLAVYDILRDDAGMRKMALVAETERGAFFDQLRKEYPRRREFFNTRVRVHPPDSALERQLAGVGFGRGHVGQD